MPLTTQKGLHQKASAILKKFSDHLFEGRDDSGTYSFLDLYVNEDKPTVGPIRLGKYHRLGYTFVDLPFRNRIMLKHLWHDMGITRLSPEEVNLVENIFQRLESDLLVPTLKAG